MSKKTFIAYIVGFTLILLSCNTDERVYENDYIKLTILKNWATIYKDKTEENLWLTIALIPTDDKYLIDSIEAPNQNLSIVATNSDEMSQKGGWFEFDEYVQNSYTSASKVSKVTDKTKISFLGKPCWYWESIRPKNKIDYLQKTYSFELDKFYITIITTQSVRLKALDTEKILNSIIFKK